MVTFLELGHAGRMGNALFQIYATIGYAKKYNVPFVFPKWEHQDMFNLPEGSFVDKGLINVSNHYQESSYSYKDIPFQDACSLSGYFQSWKYFEHCKEYIRSILLPQPIEELKEYCCVHVRRGDYLKYPNHHPTQTMQYYLQATKMVPVKKFLIFSDDVEWCKYNFKDNIFIINETSSLSSDFRKMCSCSHFIIANSSFSWWPAWLNQSDNKVVVAPSNWFGPKLKKTNPTSDLIPPEWIVL
jgi:hypothetical protein